MPRIRCGVLLFGFVALLAVHVPALAGSILRVQWDSPSDGPGNDWAHAYHKVQSAVDVAQSGDEIWVAGGTYADGIVMENGKGVGVGVYGGFAGTETARSQRNWVTNVTVLNRSPKGSVAYISGTEITRSTVIDGFTIQGGIADEGGGVFCYKSSPTISNNIIKRNYSMDYGGGVCAFYTGASPLIINNLITQNTGERGGGVGCYSAQSPVIANNTIVNNADRGIYAENASVYNNIVAFNYEGIQQYSSALLRSNCVYGNTGANYVGTDQTGINGNISVDPRFQSAEYGYFHLQPDSPCRNTGDDAVVEAGWLDIDGQARIQGTHVDIGADESDGTQWPAVAPTVVRVKTDGNDNNDGSVWELAKKTVAAGAYAASDIGGEVWVKAGTYYERVALWPFASMYGGFGGNETERAQRDPKTNVTTLNGSDRGPVIYARAGCHTGVIDGFTITHGYSSAGGGVYCGDSNVVISNNIITANAAVESGCGIDGGYGSPSIIGNVITGNVSEYDYSAGGGVACKNGVVAGNIIAGNSAESGGGVFCSGSAAIVNNTIVGNTAADNHFWGGGGGIYCWSPAQIANNIVAFNSSGIEVEYSTSPTLRNNCFYGNTNYDYQGIAAGVGDISMDPLFVNRSGGDYHLTAGSPCINAGWSGATGIPAFDMDGQGRIFNWTVDMGADEYWSASPSIANCKAAPDGAPISGMDGIVSAAFTDFFYSEAEDRSAGIRVDKAAHGLSSGMKATIAGTLATSADGERYIQASMAAQSGTGSVEPLSMPNRSVGGGPVASGQQGIEGASGLNNIGLLVRTWGKVTARESGCFWLDDGSGADDGSGNPGVKVLTNGVSLPETGLYVQVTGISSCARPGGQDLKRLIRMRDWQDLEILTLARVSGMVGQSGSQTVGYVVECAHPYANSYSYTWTITGPTGATRIRVHFTKIELETGGDFLRVKDGAGQTKQIYDSYPAITDVWSNWVTGNVIKLNLTTDSDYRYYGFKVDSYQVEAAGTPVPGVTLTLWPVMRTTGSAADGTYSFAGLEAGSYTIIPSLTGATFTPPSRSFNTFNGMVLTGQDFVRN